MHHISDYSYQELPQSAETGPSRPFTRLLWLAPGSGSQQLLGRLDIVNVEATFPYEALSYTWGTDPPNSHLWLQGRTLPIRPNLDSALRALRLPRQGRLLWVDAICIDQSNVDERSRQVRYMRLMYKHAAGVMVWTGPKSPGDDIAFETMRRMLTYRQLREDQSLESAGNDAEAVASAWAIAMDGMPEESCECLQKFWRRAYFSRCWCIQEIAAGKSAIIKCGELEIPFMVAAGCLVLLGMVSENVEPDNTLFLWYLIWQRRQRTQAADSTYEEGSLGSLLSLLEWTRSFQATDARDKIYALQGVSDEGLNPARAYSEVQATEPRWVPVFRRGLGLVLDGMNRLDPDFEFGRPRALKIDYRKSAIDTYVDVTRFMIRRAPCVLDVLDHVMHINDPEEGDYPSWTPRWFEPKTCAIMGSRVFRAGLCTGSPAPFAEVQHNPHNPRSLVIGGFQVDRVRLVSSPLKFSDRSEEISMAIIEQAWSQLFSTPLTPPPDQRDCNGEPLDLSFCKALFAHPLGEIADSDAMTNGSPSSDFIAVRFRARMHSDETPREFLAQLNQYRSSGVLQEPYESKKGLIRFMGGVRVYGQNRRVFVTKEGRLGIGPQMMQPSDEVVVLFGGQLPFVIRRRNSSHIFIGQCYLNDRVILYGKWTANVRAHGTGPASTTFTFT